MHDETKIYFIEAEHSGDVFVKIGVAVDAYKRISTVMCGCPIELRRVRVVSILTRSKALKLEKTLHRFLRKFHARGEWFMASVEGFDDLISHVTACLNMEVGVNAWQFQEIDWVAHLKKAAEKRADALRRGWIPAVQAREKRVAEMNRYRGVSGKR